MKIKLLTSITGKQGAFAPGDEVDWKPDLDARRLVEAGYAAPVRGRAVSRAVRKAPERASK